MTTIPVTGAGIAAFESESFAFSSALSGPGPTIATPEIAADNMVLAELSVVGRIGNVVTGKITLATTGNTDPADDIVPIGITAHAVADVGADQGVAVLRDGQWNPDALTWDASFSTDALKEHAFENSTGPTKITIRRPETPAV